MVWVLTLFEIDMVIPSLLMVEFPKFLLIDVLDDLIHVLLTIVEWLVGTKSSRVSKFFGFPHLIYILHQVEIVEGWPVVRYFILYLPIIG